MTSYSKVFRRTTQRHLLTLRPLPWWQRVAPPLAGLTVACATLAVLMALARSAESPAAVPLILVGMLLVIGALAGRTAEALRLPRLTGYLLVGVALSPSLWRFAGFPDLFVSSAQRQTLAPVNDLAVGVIALMAGSEIEATWLRQRLAAIMAVVGAELLVVPTTLCALLLLLPNVPFMTHAMAAGVPAVLIAALAAVILLPNGPTVVVTVLRETGASGPLSRMLMGTSVVLDAFVILLFTIVVSLIEVTIGAGGVSLPAAFASVVGGLLASVVIGGAIGWGLRRYAEHTDHRLGWIVLGTALGVAYLGTIIGLKPLFCLLAAGFAFGNLPGSDPERAEQAHARLHHTLAQVGMPIFVLFFCAAGLAVDIDTLIHGWVLVLVLLVVRDLLIFAAVHVGTRRIPAPETAVGSQTGIESPGTSSAVQRYLWIGMVSQAGVTLALVQVLIARFPGWGEHLATMIIAMVTVHEVWVPVALARALRRARETRVL